MNNMEKSYNKLIATKEAWDKATEALESKLKNRVEFDCSIVFQASDGHCLMNNDNSDLAPLGWCLNAIKEKGKLSLEDFNDLGI